LDEKEDRQALDDAPEIELVRMLAEVSSLDGNPWLLTPDSGSSCCCLCSGILAAVMVMGGRQGEKRMAREKEERSSRNIAGRQESTYMR
jgi:hypothetical protein